jgi:hypothetical protein
MNEIHKDEDEERGRRTREGVFARGGSSVSESGAQEGDVGTLVLAD